MSDQRNGDGSRKHGARGGDAMSRASNLHQARVYLTESKRRGRLPFAFLLLTWAGNARRRAMAINPMPDHAPSIH